MVLTNLNSIPKKHFNTSAHNHVSVVEIKRLLYIKVVIYLSISIQKKSITFNLSNILSHLIKYLICSRFECKQILPKLSYIFTFNLLIRYFGDNMFRSKYSILLKGSSCFWSFELGLSVKKLIDSWYRCNNLIFVDNVVLII